MQGEWTWALGSSDEDAGSPAGPSGQTCIQEASIIPVPQAANSITGIGLVWNAETQMHYLEQPRDQL